MGHQTVAQKEQIASGTRHMTKARLVESTMNLGYNQKTAGELVEAVLDLVKEVIASGEDVKISGFGKFEVRQKKDRRGRNPQTGESITIEARKIVTFKPSHLLKQTINKEA
jgi:integration host factor subunit alpha